VPVITPGWVHGPLRDALQTLRLRWPPTAESLLAAWRKRAFETHPDRGGEHGAFVAVQEAREVVGRALERGLPQPPRAGQGFAPDDHSAEYARFRSGMRRSRKGNLRREWSGRTVTVFSRRGCYHWCITEGDWPRFSRWAGWPSEDGACAALWAALGGEG
jgi:curved DNA-binding protein CbpA